MKKNSIKKQEARELHLLGYTNKQIAKKLEISEKTMSEWLKPLNGITYETMLIGMLKQLNVLIYSETPDIKDIHNLNNAIASMEKRVLKGVSK